MGFQTLARGRDERARVAEEGADGGGMPANQQ